MGLGDLLNLDFGFALDGGPTWDFGTAGYALAGPELSNAQLLADQFGMGPMRGTDFSFNVPGIDDAAMRPSVFEFSPSGDPVALGFRGGDGMIQTLDSNPIAANPFNINQSAGASGAALRNALDNLARSVGGGGGGGGNGGGLSLSLPRMEMGAAERIAPAPQGAVPAAPPAQDSFRPMVSNVPLAQGPGDSALRRLLERGF